MGARGPKPAPRHLKVLHGEKRPSRVNYREPQAPAEDEVVAPDFLDDDARAVWDRLAPTLRARSMLTIWDVDLFAVYCTAVTHHRRAARMVNADGVTVSGDGGRTVKHPAMQVLRDQAMILATLSGRFGLSPSDRAQIEMPAPIGGPASAASILD